MLHLSMDTRRALAGISALAVAAMLAACSGESDAGKPGTTASAMETCVDLTESGAGFEVDMPAEEACKWQHGISPDDFLVMYDETATEAERQAAAGRMQDAAAELEKAADDALDD